MKLLLDTHFLVWLAIEPDRVGKAARRLLSDPANDLCLSAVSLWEIRIKWQARDPAGRRKGLLSPEAALQFADVQSIALAALEPADAVSSLAVPLGHRDPFDEMLLIHADRLGAQLLTRDRQLLDHPLAYSV